MKASRPELNNQDKRAQVSLRATVIGLIANILLAASKIIVGSLTHSVAVTADGFNNLTDTGAVLVSFISLRIARKPRDKGASFWTWPYGVYRLLGHCRADSLHRHGFVQNRP